MNLALALIVALQCPDGTPPPCAATRAGPTPPRSVAVLYFASRSSDTADAYLGDGITEGIITRLTQDQRLAVKSISAVERLRGRSTPPDSAGRVLKVANLVSGSVARSGRRLRVSVELVRASTGTTLWAAQFDREDVDLFDIQTAIADSVAREIAGRLLPGTRSQPRRPSTNPEAYDLFLQGNFHLARRTPDDVRTALRKYEAAIGLDPSFAAAHARIALAYAVALDWGWPSFDIDSSIRLGLAASDRAIELDSSLADAWTSRAFMLRFANARTYAGVREAFARALRLAPRDPEAMLQFGFSLEGLGKPDSALLMLHRAVAVDPERTISRFTLAWVLLMNHQPDAAIAQADTGIANDPTTRLLRPVRAWGRLMAGDTTGAWLDARAEHDDGFESTALIAMLARRGDSTAARAEVERLAAALPAAPARLTWSAGWTALAWASLGNESRALDILERIEPQGLHVWDLMQSPGFDPVRLRPGFARFEAELASGR
ncbi:MAG TPA: hypothetical protein VGI92_08000 [Gemmatimonadales bacterium]